jgi:hypothetical protein
MVGLAVCVRVVANTLRSADAYEALDDLLTVQTHHPAS